MINRRHFLATAGGAAAAGALGFPRLAQAATPASITFGPALPVYALTFVAVEKGFFKDEGVDVKTVITDAGARSRQTLAAGDALFAHGDGSHPLQLSNRGKKAKLILATQMVPSTANMVIRQDLFDQGINTVEKLGQWKRPDGAKPIVAATAIGSGTWMLGTYVFEARKLGQNINWVAGGGSKTMLAGLQSKQFDVIMAPPAWQLEAERNGFGKTLYDVRTPGVVAQDFGGNLPVLAFYTLEDTIEQNPALVQSTVNALYKAMRWVKETPVDEVFALLGTKYYGSIDPASAKAELAFDKDTWDYNGRITKEDFDRGGRVWYRNGTDIPPMKYEDVVDMRFLDAAQKKA
ncbi:MAG: ABC transporter substrate-binding protein [Microvirga sp.]|jgi:NitT/TauT family transport system substrate-binding protein